MSQDNKGPFPPQTREIMLSRPIVVAGENTQSITLQEPTLAHAEFLDKVRFKFDQEGNAEIVGMGSTVKNAAIYLGGLTENEAGQIAASDCLAVWTAVMGFLMPSPAIGRTP